MFVYTVKLDTNETTAAQLARRFKMAEDIYKYTLRTILKRVQKQNRDPRQKQLKRLNKEWGDLVSLKEGKILPTQSIVVKNFHDQGIYLHGFMANDPKDAYKPNPGNLTLDKTILKLVTARIKTIEKERKELYRQLDLDYDLQGKFTFSKLANDYRNSRGYGPYIPSDVAGKLGIRAWDAYSKVKFNNGAKHVNLQAPLLSMEAKSDTGLVIRDGFFKMGTKGKQLQVPVLYQETPFEEDVLRNSFKFNRLVRRFERGRYQYYIQRIFDGVPPERFPILETGTVGIKVGLTTVAVVTKNHTAIYPLAPLSTSRWNDIKREEEITKLQQSLDRKRRANNPNNFNDDGTVKKGRKVWVNSKSYLRDKARLNDLKRKERVTRELYQKQLANRISQMGDHFFIMQPESSSLAKRTTKDEITKKGTLKSKTRYGKVVANHAPYYFFSQLQYKTEFKGSSFTRVTDKKLGSYNHILEDVEAELDATVKTRWVGPHLVQKDLYTAYLLAHLNDELELNHDALEQNFEAFVEMQGTFLDSLGTVNDIVDEKGIQALDGELIN